MSNLILIGKILSSHGLNGNVKLESFCENPTDIFEYDLYDKNGNLMSCKQVGKTSNSSVFLAKFDIINSIDEAQEYRNFDIYTKRENFEALDDNQFYVEDLIGRKVLADKKSGVVDNFYNYGGGDTLEVKWDNGQLESIPFNNDYIKEIKDNVIHIELPTYI